MSRLVEFQGQRYWLLFEGKGISSALAYLHHCDENGDIKPECALETSFAHLYDDGRILRFGKVIGTSADLKEITMTEPKIYVGEEADDFGQDVVKQTQLVFEVRYDAKRKQIVFLGTDILTAALTQGFEVEKYVAEKIKQARERLVVQQ